MLAVGLDQRYHKHPVWVQTSHVTHSFVIWYFNLENCFLCNSNKCFLLLNFLKMPQANIWQGKRYFQQWFSLLPDSVTVAHTSCCKSVSGICNKKMQCLHQIPASPVSLPAGNLFSEIFTYSSIPLTSMRSQIQFFTTVLKKWLLSPEKSPIVEIWKHFLLVSKVKRKLGKRWNVC